MIQNAQTSRQVTALTNFPRFENYGARIFSAGHSLHFFLPPILADIARTAGIVGHTQVGLSAIGRSRVIQHWELNQENNLARNALEMGYLDVLTLSPIHLPDPGIEKFASCGLKHNRALRILIQEFWLPYDIYDVTFTLRPSFVDQDAQTGQSLRDLHAPYFRAMDNEVRELNLRFHTRAVQVVPVGQAVIALREKVIAGEVPGIRSQSDLFVDQVGHPKAALKALVAYCHFAVIYRRNPVGLRAPAILRDTRLAPLLQQLAWDAVTAHPLSGVRHESVSYA